jgi:CheY-like chemotaxis protein
MLRHEDQSNVLEAIAALGQHAEIDALITDIDMPGTLNGLDLARLVRGFDSEVAIIVTSGRHIVTDWDLPSGGRFLRKPYRMDDVFAVLEETICADAVDADIRRAV